MLSICKKSTLVNYQSRSNVQSCNKSIKLCSEFPSQNEQTLELMLNYVKLRQKGKNVLKLKTQFIGIKNNSKMIYYTPKLTKIKSTFD